MTTGATTTTTGRLGLLERAVSVWCGELDPAVLSGSDAADGVKRLSAMMRWLTAAQSSLVARVDETHAYRSGRNGHQDTASWLANTTGTSVGEAQRALRVGERLKDGPQAKDA